MARRTSLDARRSPHGYEEAEQAAAVHSLSRASRRALPSLSVRDWMRSWAGCMTQVQIPYNLIPHFPGTTVQGHGGTLHLGTWKGVPVAILEGRVHCYEGHAPATVVFPVRALALAGVETFILTCAAGGIAAKSKPGGFMVFSDHLHLQGVNPLVGVHDPRWGAQFVDLTEAYDPRLRAHHAERRRASCACRASKACTLPCSDPRMRRRRKFAP